MSTTIAGVDSTGGDFSPSSDMNAGFDGGEDAGISPTSANGGLATQLRQLIGLLQKVLENLSGEQAPPSSGGEGGTEQTGGPGKPGGAGEPGCPGQQGRNCGDGPSDPNERGDTLVLQAIQLLVQALLGDHGSSSGGGGREAVTSTNSI